VLRNYGGFDYHAVLKLPLRVFWTLNAQINRLRAEENLERLELVVLGLQGVTPEMFNEYRTRQVEIRGEPMKVTEVEAPDTFKKGLEKLRQLSG
jgi:hypothetical protein